MSDDLSCFVHLGGNAMSQVSGNGFITDGANATVAPWLAPSGGTAGTFPAGSPANARWGTADGVRPAWFGGDALNAAASSLPGGAFGASGGGAIGTILGQLATMVQQYIGRLGSALLGTPSTAQRPSGSATFQNVALASTGDPHLSVTGTAIHADGGTAAVDAHYDSMTAHDDLFSARDFGDGFTVSTAVTQPSANGVTQNASATASMNGGSDAVTMTAAGAVSVTSGGMAVALAPDQSLQLAGGATVREAANGSVTIDETAYGSTLSTTFASNGTGGVDVTASGSNVTLAGDLIARR